MVADGDLPYQALYRRFRPQRFSEVLGQDHVTRALRSAVRDGKVVHAYLFSGPRGTGKTSTARILAMALNCENPQDGEPCGECRSCVAVRTGASLDVQELDSATNRGVDEMRDLLSRVSLGTPGRWKVYIVDEVHQITTTAASALLKTLEEPPAHVIFVLATTDPQKVMETIRSRTQHFEFRLLSSDVLGSLLADVAKRAELDLPADALDVVVRRGHGSARDALSALDQVAAAGSVYDDTTLVSELVDAVVERDAGGVLVKVAEATTSGLDARRLGAELLEHLRNGFLATRARDLVLLSEQATSEVADQAAKLGAAALVRAMELIGQALIDMRDSADPRTTLEVALVRLAAPEADDSRAALLERIERLERALAGGAEAAIVTGSASPAPAAAAAPAAPPAPPRPAQAAPPARPGAPLGAAPPLPPRSGAAAGPPRPAPGRPAAPTAPATPTAAPSAPTPAAPSALTAPDHAPSGPAAGPVGDAPSREELTLAWGDRILTSLRPAVKVYVATGRFLPTEGEVAVYAVPDRGLLTRADANRGEVEDTLSAHFGRPIRIRFVLDESSGPVGQPARGPSGPPAVADVSEEEQMASDWADMQEAPSGAATPEQRLMDAFPGAEEVAP